MSLKHALLGLLLEEAASGYELTKRLDDNLGRVWSASHSQVYPTLARLVDTGLVELESADGPRGRKQYRLTDAGSQELLSWLDEPSDHTQRNEFLLRIYFLWRGGRDTFHRYLDNEEAWHRERLELLTNLPIPAKHNSPQWVSYRIAREAGIRRVRSVIEWTEWARDFVEAELEDDD